MGAWGVKAFDNDSACDWAYGLKKSNNLAYIESTFTALEAIGDDYLEVDDACNALAACEVLARLLGHPGYQNSYTKEVDEWVAKCKIIPTPPILARATSAIDRILGENSEVRELWDDGDGSEWHQAVDELRDRLSM